MSRTHYKTHAAHAPPHLLVVVVHVLEPLVLLLDVLQVLPVVLDLIEKLLLIDTLLLGALQNEPETKRNLSERSLGRLRM